MVELRCGSLWGARGPYVGLRDYILQVKQKIRCRGVKIWQVSQGTTVQL